MRIRTIKPEFWEHPVMIRQSDATKLLAIGLLNLADDDGYFYADPKAVRNSIRQNDDDSRIATVSLRDLSEIGYISIRNHATHGPIGKIESFAAHQVINKPKPSKIKALYEYGIDTVLIPDEERLEGKGMEGNKEGKGNENMSADADEIDLFTETETTPKKKPTGQYPPEVIELWDMFPAMARTRSSKADFWAQYRQATNKPPHADLVSSVAAWARCDEWTKNNGQFAPRAHLFFKNRKWESEPVMYSPTRQKGTIENIQLKILNGPDKNV
jgi:hypothetical protein